MSYGTGVNMLFTLLPVAGSFVILEIVFNFLAGSYVRLVISKDNLGNKILCFSDLFLLPSEAESFGLAALEAMVNRVPVISSNAGGIPEVNVDGVTGYLSNVGNIADMAQNAIRILEDDKILEEFKTNAKKEAAKFDIQNIVPLYEELYERALVKA